jgi:hypothetical protein
MSLSALQSEKPLQFCFAYFQRQNFPLLACLSQSGASNFALNYEKMPSSLANHV